MKVVMSIDYINHIFWVKKRIFFPGDTNSKPHGNYVNNNFQWGFRPGYDLSSGFLRGTTPLAPVYMILMQTHLHDVSISK